MSIFGDGVIDPTVFSNAVHPALRELYGVRIRLRADRLGPAHFIFAVRRADSSGFDEVLGPHMEPGRTPDSILAALEGFVVDDAAPPVPPAEIGPDQLEPAACRLLEAVQRELPATREAVSRSDSLLAMVRLSIEHLEEHERRVLGYLMRLEQLEAAPVADVTGSGCAEIFAADGSVAPEILTDGGVQLIEEALRYASITGYSICHLTHFLLACFESRNVRIRRIFRIHGEGPALSLARTTLEARITRDIREEPARLHRDSFGSSARMMLERAARASRRVGAAQILRSLLESADLDPIVASELTHGPLHLQISSALRALDRSFDVDPGEDGRVAPPRPPFLLGFEELSASLVGVPAGRYVDRPEAESLQRGLFAHRERCVLVSGEPGVGSSALVEIVARRAAAGEVKFLAEQVFLRGDARHMDPEKRKSFFSAARGSLASLRNLVIVIENIHLLVEGDAEPLARLLSEDACPHVVGLTGPGEGDRILALHPDLPGRVWSVRVEEPDREVALRILDVLVPGLEEELGFPIDRAALGDLQVLADDYLSGTRMPKRVVDLLRLAAEQAAYESAERGGGTLILGQETAARALADRRSITPEEVLAGRGEEYFRRELGKMVFGQAEAVDRAAHAIASARGGLSSGNLPAGVLMFVGQSGTGKTLLAHAMGRLYSRSGRVRVFSMGDFTESHSVARLLGAPPGYVGYERGGGVVNALLQDPASVLLFDEVEKADPEVLKFLLQLLDSPRVEDAAGRSASTTSAIIVLTSNLCSEVVDRAARNGKPYEQIAREMATAIRKERRKSGQLYFRPELLNRMRDMVVFRPLGEDTLEAIAVHEIQEAVRSVRRLKSLLLVASAGSWSPLATVLTGLCRGDEKHGRAARHVLDRLLLSPLAGYAPPPGVGNEIRVEVDVEGLLVRLFDPTGCPVGAREALE